MDDSKIRVAISADVFTNFAGIQRHEQNKVINFINKFRNNPKSSGINYEKILGAYDQNLRSVRIDENYRGIILKPKDNNVYLLLWIDKHDDAYKWAMRKRTIVNEKTGSIQVYDVEDKSTSISNEENKTVTSKEKLFKEIEDEVLLKIGVPHDVIDIVRNIYSIEELNEKKSLFPEEAYEALYFLAEGSSVEEIIDTYENKDKSIINTNDFAGSLDNLITKKKFFIVDDEDEDNELKKILDAPLEQWRVFLHPSQRKIVEKNANGPIRVLGGAGTGKTVVAMHRAKWLAENIYLKKEEKILFTTFTRNLAEDIKSNLRKICKPDTMKKIDVVNIDAWVNDFLKSNNYNYKIIYGKELDDIWKLAFTVMSDEVDVNEEFYKDEWEQVIVPNEITNKKEYLKVSRIGRGVRLDRKARSIVWEVFEEFKSIMADKKVRDNSTAMMEARLILENHGSILPYKAVIVDEGQDLGAQTYKLIRAIAGQEHSNDIFIVGDTHQRIYSNNKVALSKCGINIRGRSSKLKINYRTTEETRNWAFKILNNISFDDMDEGKDDSKNYKSLVHGPKPSVKLFNDIDKEIEYIVKEIKDLNDKGVELSNICVVARIDKQIEMYREHLRDYGIKSHKIKRKEAENRSINGVRIATMHRVKGLEFDYIFLVGINENIVPYKKAIGSDIDKTSRNEKIINERSLLYVAATRAKKEVFVSSYGKASEFL